MRLAPSTWKALAGRFVLFFAATMVLAGLLIQQTATAPGPARPLTIVMKCMSPAHPEWGAHGCSDPAWSTAG